jgi:hypothetical protein
MVNSNHAGPVPDLAAARTQVDRRRADRRGEVPALVRLVASTSSRVGCRFCVGVPDDERDNGPRWALERHDPGVLRLAALQLSPVMGLGGHGPNRDLLREMAKVGPVSAVSGRLRLHDGP